MMSMQLWSAYPLTDEGESPFVQVVRSIRESVVNIRLEYEVDFSDRMSPFPDDFFRFFFPELPDSRRSVGMGSGFIFHQEGDDVFILTNNHLVNRGEDGELTVTLADKDQYPAEIVGLDPETDLAVIKITVNSDVDVIKAPLGDSDKIEIGDWAIAIGNPFGRLGLDRTVTVGVISATNRANLNFGQDSPMFQDFIQTDAAINPGNSGGPLLNLKGEVIGINSAITSTTGGNLGIGFAIPINLAKRVVEDLLSEGVVRRAYLGISLQDITPDLRQSLNLDEIAGILVSEVMEDTPAESAGLQSGDVIIEFDGKRVPDSAKFRIMVAHSPVGEEIPMRVIRDSKKQTIYVTLKERPDTIAQAPTAKPDTQPSEWLGLEVVDLESDFAQSRNVTLTEGVMIRRIASNSPAARSELRVGDVILEIDRQPINSVNDYNNVTSEIESGIVLLYIKTLDGNYRYLTVRLE
jgi:serine protease Do